MVRFAATGIQGFLSFLFSQEERQICPENVKAIVIRDYSLSQDLDGDVIVVVVADVFSDVFIVVVTVAARA